MSDQHDGEYIEDAALAATKLVNHYKPAFDALLRELEDSVNVRLENLSDASQLVEVNKMKVIEAQREVQHRVNKIEELQIQGSRAALIGSHSDTANLENRAQRQWRNITLVLWVLMIIVGFVTATLIVINPPDPWTWQYALARGPFGTVFIVLAFAIRYTSNRAEDHRIQELIMTNVALAIRSSEGYAKAIAEADKGEQGFEHSSRKFLTDISSTLFTEPIEALIRRGETRWNRRSRLSPTRTSEDV